MVTRLYDPVLEASGREDIPVAVTIVIKVAMLPRTLHICKEFLRKEAGHAGRVRW